MANFLRHVGKVGDRKVAVVFREVPGETHMCLVVFTEILGSNIHDPLIKTIESDIGQHSKNLADALNRTYTKDGHIILQKLHAEGMLKKVQTEQVIMTPSPNTKIRLNDLNKMLDEMEQGEAAVKRMAELDMQTGIQDPAAVARRMRGDKDAYTPETIPAPAPSGWHSSDDTLGDNTIADNLRQQALRMSSEAKGLLAEADRLLHEAASLDPAPVAVSRPVVDGTSVKKSRGRPKKVSVTV